MAFSGMTEKEIAAYRNYFWAHCKSGDTLHRKEFKEMTISLGMQLTDREITKAFNAADQDRSGEISFNEFAATYLNRKIPKIQYSEQKLRQVFGAVDKDKDGVLTTDECLKAMKMLQKNLSEDGAKGVMQVMDKNRSGGVTYKEFLHFMEV